MRKHRFIRPITIYLEKEQFSEVEQITNKTDISIGAWFRSLLDEKLAQERKKELAPLDVQTLKKKVKAKADKS